MAMKYTLRCGCGNHTWTISDGTSGTKVCPRCRRQIQFRASGGKVTCKETIR